MRIAHVVTLLSPDGAYGGPVRVALNQLRQLQDMGHEVCLYAGYRDYDHAPTEMNGVPVRAFKARRIFPKTGFAGLTSSSLLAQLWRELSTYDVVHVHLARDLITLPSAALAATAGIPLIVQTHGMIDRSSHPLAKPLDFLLTRRILATASTVLYLTPRERQDLEAHGVPSLNLTHLVNGVPATDLEGNRERSEVEVLFLARLQSRKRPALFANAAARLTAEFDDATFTLVGPDEGEGDAVAEVIADSDANERISWHGPLDLALTLERMSRASIYVLPSINEPFPMSVLEAASVGLPVVITDTCGLAAAVKSYNAGYVVDQSLQSLIAAIRALLEDAELRAQMGENARRMVGAEFSMAAVAQQLDKIYTAAIHTRAPR